MLLELMSSHETEFKSHKAYFFIGKNLLSDIYMSASMQENIFILIFKRSTKTPVFFFNLIGKPRTSHITPSPLEPNLKS